MLFDLDDVVGLEVAVHQPASVQVAQRGEHLDGVGQGVGHRQGRLGPAALEHDLAQRLPADVLHDDVAGRLPGPAVLVLHEVVDPDDARVLDLGQEPPLGDRGGLRVGVPGVQQALEHHPPVADVAVAGQVDPAEAAVRQAAEHLVLAGDQLAGLQSRLEREQGAAVPAEAVGAPGDFGGVRAAPAHRLPAHAAEPPALRDLRELEHGLRRVTGRDRRDLHQAGAEAASGRAGRRPGRQGAARRPACGPGTGRAGGPGGRAARGSQAADGAVAVFDGSAASGPVARRGGRRCSGGRGRRSGRRGEPADGAVAVFDGPVASGPVASRGGHDVSLSPGTRRAAGREPGRPPSAGSCRPTGRRRASGPARR